MRFLTALALATAIAAGLIGGPASAAETCEMGRAVYTLKDAPGYRLEFRFDRKMRELSETTSPTIYYDVRASMRHRSGVELAEFMFYSPSSSGSKTQMAAVISSRYILDERDAFPGMSFPTAFPVIALSEDFDREGIRYSSEAAPSALILAGVASALTFSTNYGDPNHEVLFGMPEGAWILTACR